jgi:hypothetical protein
MLIINKSSSLDKLNNALKIVGSPDSNPKDDNPDPLTAEYRLDKSKFFNSLEVAGSLDKNPKDDNPDPLTAEERKKQIDNQGLQEFYKLRTGWSCFIMFAIGILILFQIGFSFTILFCKTEFIKSDGILYLIVGENFAQVVALAFIVVKFLFKDPKINNN